MHSDSDVVGLKMLLVQLTLNRSGASEVGLVDRAQLLALAVIGIGEVTPATVSKAGVTEGVQVTFTFVTSWLGMVPGELDTVQFNAGDPVG
jgi:hypothetical protein